jgi:hypothetical protein
LRQTIFAVLLVGDGRPVCSERLDAAIAALLLQAQNEPGSVLWRRPNGKTSIGLLRCTLGPRPNPEVPETADKKHLLICELVHTTAKRLALKMQPSIVDAYCAYCAPRHIEPGFLLGLFHMLAVRRGNGMQQGMLLD